MTNLRRSFAVGALSVLAVGSAAWAQAGGQAQAAGQAAPPPGPVPAANTVSVAILPFRPIRSDAATDWLGEGIKESIVAELSKYPSIDLHDLSSNLADADAALAAAQVAHVSVIVFGTFQTSADEIRATGKIMLADGRQVAVVSSKAKLKEPFRLQDDLAEQVRKVLVADTANAPRPATQPETTALATAIPFDGSSLQRALRDEDQGRNHTPSAPPRRSGDNGAGYAPGYSGSLGGSGYGGGFYVTPLPSPGVTPPPPTAGGGTPTPTPSPTPSPAPTPAPTPAPATPPAPTPRPPTPR